MIQNNTQPKTNEAVIDKTIYKKRVPKTKRGICITGNDQNWSSYKLPRFIDQVDIASRSVKHCCSYCRSKLLNTIAKQRSIISLIIFDAVSADIIVLHLPVLTIEISELVV